MQPFKDHYKTLEVQPSSAQEDIKKAYRALAFKYHPDTNPGNEYAVKHFLEIQEAYEVLGNPDKRIRYDEERWLMGMGTRAKDIQLITPQWILAESRKLSAHMRTIDTYRMSHAALQDYIFLLLSDDHMAILQKEQDDDTNISIVQELLQATRHLRYEHMEPVAARLAQLVRGYNEPMHRIHRQVERARYAAMWDKYRMWLILVIAIVLCVLMYAYGR